MNVDATVETMDGLSFLTPHNREVMEWIDDNIELPCFRANQLVLATSALKSIVEGLTESGFNVDADYEAIYR